MSKINIMNWISILLISLLANVSFSRDYHRNGVIFKNGNPVFPIAAWCLTEQNNSYEMLSRLGLNSVLIRPGQDKKWNALCLNRGLLDTVWSNGLYAIVYFQELHHLKRYKPNSYPDIISHEVLKYKEHPGLLAWDIIDDGNIAHLPMIMQISNAIKKCDTQHPVVGDIWPREKGHKHWPWTPRFVTSKFKPELDILLQYFYPAGMPTSANKLSWNSLQDKTEIYKTGKVFSLEEYYDWLCSTVRNYGPIWTFIQAFTDKRAFKYFGMSPPKGRSGNATGPYPEPEQLRLMTYAAVCSGVKGVIFFAIGCDSYCQLNDPLVGNENPATMCEISLLAREMKICNDFLTIGVPIELQNVKDKGVIVKLWKLKDNYLLLLLRNSSDSMCYVDSVDVKNLELILPKEVASKKCVINISYDIVEPKLRLVLPSTLNISVMSQSMAILFTDDEKYARRIERKYSDVSAEIAALSLRAAKYQYRKIKDVYGEIGNEIKFRNAEKLFSQIEKNIILAEEQFKRKNFLAVISFQRQIYACC